MGVNRGSAKLETLRPPPGMEDVVDTLSTPLPMMCFVVKVKRLERTYGDLPNKLVLVSRLSRSSELRRSDRLPMTYY